MSHPTDCECPKCQEDWGQLERLVMHLGERGFTEDAIEEFCEKEQVSRDKFTVHACNMPEEA
jgi:hypothetical protein